MAFGIYAREIVFSDKTSIPLEPNSILVITGPNNVGKSSALTTIWRNFDGVHRTESASGNVVKAVSKEYRGTEEELFEYLSSKYEYDSEKDSYAIDGYRSYKTKTLKSGFEKGALPEVIESDLAVRLSAAQRLGSSDFNSENRYSRVETLSNQLFSNEPEEIRISDVFRRAFGKDLILDRSRLSGKFHIGDRKKLPSHKKRLEPSFKKKMEELPEVVEQGDGIRSFTRILIQILVDPGNVVVVDEPELFLHPPQIRQLARFIASDTPPDTQLFIATHSEQFLRGLLEFGSDRVTVARIERQRDTNPTSVLNSDNIKLLWRDPLLQTSNALSALFHDVAVICEGETDARFLRALLDATEAEDYAPDVDFYHCGGKDKIYSIINSLNAVRVPTIAITDIDILSNKSGFKRLFESLGGNFDEIRADVSVILKSLDAKRASVTGDYFVSEISAITSDLPSKPTVPQSVSTKIRSLLMRAEPWSRIKEDGYRGFSDAKAIGAFKKVEDACFRVGLLINPEGELEGFCRDISRNNKGEWLATVLSRDLGNDQDLSEARKFAEKLRKLIMIKVQS